MNLLFNFKRLTGYDIKFLLFLVTGLDDDPRLDQLALKNQSPELASEMIKMIKMEKDSRFMDKAACEWKLYFDLDDAPGAVILERQRLFWRWIAWALVACERKPHLWNLAQFFESLREQAQRALHAELKKMNKDFLSQQETEEMFEQILNEIRQEAIANN